MLIEGGVFSSSWQILNKMSANLNSKGEIIEGVDVGKSFLKGSGISRTVTLVT